MTEEVTDLLVQWGFEKYVDVFKENEVDTCALKLLSRTEVSALIPAIGPQAKFMKQLSDWKGSIELSNNTDTLQGDSDLEAIISKYGDSLDGLTSSLSSPIRSLPASPSTSTVSVYSDTQCDLTSLLKTSPDGQLLLKHSQEKALGEEYRKIIVRVISKEILKQDPKAPITAETYLKWLQEIKRLFPSENEAIYYTKAKVGVRRAHGRLYDAVVNLKAKYRRHNVYQPRARRSLVKTLTPEPSTSTQSVDIHTSAEFVTQEEEECLEWLRCHSDDYALCAEKWRITNNQRKQRVLSNERISYLLEFPCLKRSWGHALLTADFDHWYPQNENSFEDKLPLLKTKLATAARCSTRRSQFVEELKQLVQNEDPETSNLALVLLIPHMIGPVYLKKKRMSAAEVRQSFILHIEEEKELLEERLKRKNRYKTLGITVQPYIVVAGPLKNITARYIVVDDIIYELPTISKTVDSCFKITWALNLEYPSECLPVWQFLEKVFYKFPANVVSQKPTASSVLSLLIDCGISSE